MRSYYTSGEIPLQGNWVVVPRPSINEIVQFLKSPKSETKIASIYGCRQSGKTTVILRLLEAASPEMHAVRVDLRHEFARGGDRTIDQALMLQLLLKAMAAELGQIEAHDRWIEENCEQARQFKISENRVFDNFVQRIASAATKPILMVIDEFDILLSFGRRWEFLLDCVYDHLHSRFAGKVRFIIAGLRPPNALQLSWEESKYVIFQLFPIHDFPIGDSVVEDALSQGLPSCHEQTNVVRMVLDATGGQPYLTCRLLEDINDVGEVSAAGANRAIENFVQANRFSGGRDVSGRDPHFDFHGGYLEAFPKYTLRALDAFTTKRNDVAEEEEIDGLIQSVLIGSGLMALRNGQLAVKSRINKVVFDDVWARKVRASRTIEVQHRQGRTTPRPRVVVANLGGTLGMEVQPDGKVVEPDDPAAFFRRFEGLTAIVDPIIETPARPTDSANITPDDWRRLAETIFAYRSSDIHGVLVVQGTDTMAYSAAAVAYALGPALPFPVVFTGSQAPYNALHADAQVNVMRACKVLEQFGRKSQESPAEMSEVVVVFGDSVFRAVRVEKKDDFRFEGFHSPSQGPIAIVGQSIQTQSSLRRSSGVADWTLRAEFEDRVLMISQYPGLRSEYVDALLDHQEVKGIIFESLGVGNLPNLPNTPRYSLMDVIAKATQLGIPVLVSSRYPVVPEFAANYQPAMEPLARGAISAGDMTPAAAITKFMWAIRQVDLRVSRGDITADRRMSQIQTFMKTDYVGEIGSRNKSDLNS
jgi:L-asparaginase